MSKSGGMSGLSKQVAQDTNAALQAQELKLLTETSDNWERFRPQVADQAAYDALIAVVKTWSARNENLAQLRARIEALGRNGVAVSRRVLELLKSA
jgi:hypothetical protein